MSIPTGVAAGLVKVALKAFLASSSGSHQRHSSIYASFLYSEQHERPGLKARQYAMSKPPNR